MQGVEQVLLCRYSNAEKMLFGRICERHPSDGSQDEGKTMVDGLRNSRGSDGVGDTRRAGVGKACCDLSIPGGCIEVEVQHTSQLRLWCRVTWRSRRCRPAMTLDQASSSPSVGLQNCEGINLLGKKVAFTAASSEELDPGRSTASPSQFPNLIESVLYGVDVHVVEKVAFYGHC